MKKKIKKPKKKIIVDLALIKTELSNKVSAKYGSVYAFSKHQDSKDLGIEKSVRTILQANGGNSVPVLNKLLEFFLMPTITMEQEIVKTIVYYQEAV